MSTIKHQIGLDLATLINIDIVNVNTEKLFADEFMGIKNKVYKISTNAHTQLLGNLLIPPLTLSITWFSANLL